MGFDQIRAIIKKELGIFSDESCVRIHLGFSPGNSSGERLLHHIQSKIEKGGWPVEVIKTGSFGCGDLEPIAIVEVPGHSVELCLNAGPEIVADIELIACTTASERRDGDWYLITGDNNRHIPLISDLPLFNLQNRIVLRNCGWIDPADLRHSIHYGNGFAGLARALLKDRKEFVPELLSSLPEGYIRSGCSTPDQWKECAASESPDKYLICDAATADPMGAGTPLLLESDPHSVFEGMLVGAYMIGASHCILYVSDGSNIAFNLRSLLDKMLTCNLVGSYILDSTFEAQIEIKEVPDNFRAGNRIESVRCVVQNNSDPHILPELPLIEELTANPVVSATPELMSFLPVLFLTDKELKYGFGADRNGASGIVALSGNIEHPITAEIPCGISISSVIEDIGGGVTGNKPLKAIQIGVPAGVLLGPGELDGCMHCRISGENGIVKIDVIDCEADIIALAATRMVAANDQSCGKCLFCFEGSRQMLQALERIYDGNGKPRDLDLLTELGETMKTACLCAFGRATPDFVLSSLELYREEYERRINASSCDV